LRARAILASVVIGVLQLPYDGLKSFTEVQRMARRAVIGEFEGVRLDAFAEIVRNSVES
jgi:hypothetical protein